MQLKNSHMYPFLFSFFLSSCANFTGYNDLQKNAVTTSSKNQELVPAVREPSSSIEEENLKNSFERLINSEDPESEFLTYLDRLKSFYVRAESSLSDFDKELDESVTNATGLSFDNSKQYKKMIVIWGLSHRLQDKIIYHYSELTDMAYDKNKSFSQRKLAKNILFKFKKKLDSVEPVEKISYDELKLDIVTLLKTKRRSSNKSILLTDIPSASFKSEQDKLKTLRLNRAKFRAMGRSKQAQNDEINQQIERDAGLLQLIDQKGREPQQEAPKEVSKEVLKDALKFYPSTTSSGNVMGLIFPKNVWALTFDDGPNPVHTTNIVKNLSELGTKATFFWLAENVIRYQSVVDLVKESGFAMANHSWTHAQLTKISDDELQKEVVQSTEVETKAYGEKPEFFRCPYGSGNSVFKIRKLIADNGMIHVFWNVDTLDWQDKDPDSIVERAKKQMLLEGHGVILFHDIHPQSVIASKKLVEWSKTFAKTENEVRWVTLPEIISEMNGVKKTETIVPAVPVSNLTTLEVTEPVALPEKGDEKNGAIK
jgi:peptidoglycan/xylan/chitin deacetylase (PgdA/CDA1 family)